MKRFRDLYDRLPSGLLVPLPAPVLVRGYDAEAQAFDRRFELDRDEYDFIPESLNRWRDRDYDHKDPWRHEPSMIRGIFS